MFLGGIPEAAGSAALLRKAGYSPKTIFARWSVVPVAGIVATAAGSIYIGSSASLVAAFAQALARGAVLAVVVHAMIPEAIEVGGSLVVLPTVAGFYLRTLSRAGPGTPLTGPPSLRRRAPPNSLQGENSACSALMRA